MLLRRLILKGIYKLSPFDIKGDADIRPVPDNNVEISCLIPTYQRPDELARLLNSLSRQDLEKSKFEVIVVEDNSTNTAEDTCRGFSGKIDLTYVKTERPIHLLGKIRNISLERSRGRRILFLDDDTVITDSAFLTKLTNIFDSYSPDIIQPHGIGLKGYIKNYSYLDPYAFVTKCCAYKRETLAELKGFISGLRFYEDIDLAIRAMILDKKVYRAQELGYYHPPFCDSLAETILWGRSFAKLKERYSFLFWVTCFLNGIRFIPLLALPSRKARQWGKVSLGILLGTIFP